MQRKITIVGAGNVGGTIADRLSEREWAEVILLDVLEGTAKGKALDLLETGPIDGCDAWVSGTSHYADTADSDIVIITAGKQRRPGMSRDQLLNENARIVAEVTRQIVKYSPNCIIIMVSNPLDAMCQVAYETSGFSKQRIIGMAGVLDSARMRTFIAMELNVSVENTTGFVMGGHGDTMVPIPRFSTVAGIPITEFLNSEQIERIMDRTRNGGAEIVDLMQTATAYYAPAASVVVIVDAIVHDKHKILPCSAYLEGEYGVHNLFVGVPIKVGKCGVEKIIEVKLNPEEDKALKKSADAGQDLIRLWHESLQKQS